MAMTPETWFSRSLRKFFEARLARPIFVAAWGEKNSSWFCPMWIKPGSFRLWTVCASNLHPSYFDLEDVPPASQPALGSQAFKDAISQNFRTSCARLTKLCMQLSALAETVSK